jgi:hypothetical protein
MLGVLGVQVDETPRPLCSWSRLDSVPDKVSSDIEHFSLSIKVARLGPSVTEVISAILFDVAVLEMGEDECGAGNVADLAGGWR